MHTIHTLNNDVITLGFRRGVDIHLLCTAAGLDTIPPPLRVDHTPGSVYRDVWLAADTTNVVALRLMGVITDGDAQRILNRSTD